MNGSNPQKSENHYKEDVPKKEWHRNRSECSLELIKALGPIKRVTHMPTSLNVEDKGLEVSQEV